MWNDAKSCINIAFSDKITDLMMGIFLIKFCIKMQSTNIVFIYAGSKLANVNRVLADGEWVVS